MSHSSGTQEGPSRATGPSYRAFSAPIIASIAFVLELTLVPLLLPLIQGEFGLSLGELAWVFNSYGLAVAIGVLIGGWFGDLFGSRNVFVVGAVCFASGSLLVAFVDSLEGLLFGRTLQGLGGGVFSPLIPLLLTGVSPNRPGWVLIVWSGAIGYVAALAPLIYSSVFGDQNWDWAFVFLGVLAVGAILLLDGSQSRGQNLLRPGVLKGYARLLQSRRVWLMLGYVSSTYGAITFYLFKLPVWLISNEFDAAWVGLVISMIWLSFATLSTLLRNRVDNSQVYQILLASPLLISAGFPLSFYGETLLAIVLASVLVGAGLACSNAPSTQMILRFTPAGIQGLSASLDITFARLGGVATVALLASADYTFATWVVVLLCGFAFFCALIVTCSQSRRSGHPGPSRS